MEQQIILCCKHRNTRCPQAKLENQAEETFVVWDVDQSETGKLILTYDQIEMLADFSRKALEENDTNSVV